MKYKKRKEAEIQTKKMIKVILICFIIWSIIYAIGNKQNIKLYNAKSINKLQFTTTVNAELQNPSFEADDFDSTKEFTYNKNITGWKTPNSEDIIGVKYNPQMLDNDTQYFFELNNSEKNSFFYNIQLQEDTEYNWNIVHRSRGLNSKLGYCTAAIIIGPKQEVEPSKDSESSLDHFMKITAWLKENDNMTINKIGVSEEHIVYTSKFSENGEFVSETFSLTPTNECTEKWSVWLVKDSAFSFGEYDVKFDSGSISDAVVAISFFETTLTKESAGNLIKEFNIYNDNQNILNLNAKEIYENNKELLANLETNGYSTVLPSANSTNVNKKEGIWSSTESSKTIEIGIWSSSKNIYELISLSNINASDGEQFILAEDIYQTIATPVENNVIKINFDSRTLYTNSTKNRLFITDSEIIPSENPETKKNQFDYIIESSIVTNTFKEEGLGVIYTPKFDENGKFIGEPKTIVSLQKNDVCTEKMYIYTYNNSLNTEWTNYEVKILNTSNHLGENLTLYFKSSEAEGFTNFLDNVQVTTESFNTFEGEGTKQSPYLIEDEEDFINFRKISITEGQQYKNTYFKQTNNITLTRPVEKGFFEFHGVYDGSGYYLKNLIFSENKGNIAATFINSLYGTVKNLGLKNVEYTNTSSSCGFADYLYGTIENCWITGNMTATSWNASIASGVFNQGQIKNTYFAGTLTGGTNFGAASYRAGSTPTFINVFSTTEDCITAYNAPNVTPTIVNCETRTIEQMKTQEFLNTLNQYVDENNGLVRWLFDVETGLPVLTQDIIEKPEINEIKAVVDSNNSTVLWMYDKDTKEYNLFLPKSADRSKLKVIVDYSNPQIEASVYDENNTKLGTLQSGKENNYFTKDKVILAFEEENTEKYTINVMQSTLPSVFLNVEGGDEALSQINADPNHDVGFPGTAVINSNSNNSTTTTFKKMKGRGNFTWKCSKKPYQVSFDEKISMLGMPQSKKWLFITNYIEGSLTRSAMFYKLTQELGIQYAITFETADLYINGKYNGTYLVTSKVESGTNRVEITKDDYLMEIDNYEDTIQFTTTRTNKKITIKSPDVEDATVEEQQSVINEAKAYLDSIETLIYDEDITFEELSKKIDMESFAKCYWIYEISMNYDAMYGSSYMYTKDGLLYMGPMWDFDNTLNLLTKNATPLNSYYLLGNNGGAADKRLRWYNELMKHQEFSDLVDKVFLENIDKFDELVEYAKQYNKNITASAKMNYIRWPYDKMKQEHGYYMGGNSFEEASQNLISDIAKRVDFYKSEYSNLIINQIKYETTDVNGQKIVSLTNLGEVDKIEIPNTVAADADIKLTGISENNIERDIGTVKLKDGKFKGNITVSNIINVTLDKKFNRGVYPIEIKRAILEVKSIEITQIPNKTEYFEGQNLDINGMIVIATYSDNTKSEINTYEVDLKENLKVSDKKVCITYEGKTAEFNITVKENSITKLEIVTPPTKTEYSEGQTFDKTGMRIKATYLDGTEKEITNYVITKMEPLKVEDKTIAIEYEGLTVNIDIIVKNKVYNILEGEKKDFIKNQDGDTSIRIDADASLFLKVYMDDQEIDKNNYIVTSGSTIITLKQSYLNILSIGSHTIKTVFSDNGVAYSTINIQEKENEEEQTEQNNNKDNQNIAEDNSNIYNKVQSNNPTTGDKIIKYIILFACSVIGAFLTVRLNIKQKFGKH